MGSSVRLVMVKYRQWMSYTRICPCGDKLPGMPQDPEYALRRLHNSKAAACLPPLSRRVLQNLPAGLSEGRRRGVKCRLGIDAISRRRFGFCRFHGFDGRLVLFQNRGKIVPYTRNLRGAFRESALYASTFQEDLRKGVLVRLAKAVQYIWKATGTCGFTWNAQPRATGDLLGLTTPTGSAYP